MNPNLQLSELEYQMAQEVFEILEKYSNNVRAFNLQLSHYHFSMDSGEVLYETHDAKKRVLTSKPVMPQSVPGALATAWGVNRNKEIEVLALCCDSVIQK